MTIRCVFSYKVAVRAFDAAGQQSSTAWSPPILVDVTPPEGISCHQYRQEAETNLTLTPQTSSFRSELYEASLEVNLPPASLGLLKVVVTANSLRPGARGAVTVDDVTMPLVFRSNSLDKSSTAEHVLMLGPGALGQTQRVAVTVRGNAGASVTARVSTCPREGADGDGDVDSSVSAASSSGSDHRHETAAVTLRQVSLSTLSVLGTIVDEESSVMSLQVGVGSTPGGLQVEPLTPVGPGSGGQALVLVRDVSHVQHGSPLFAVVRAQNHASLAWAHFLSAPVVFDTSPPALTSLEVSLLYAGGDGEGGGVEVTAVAAWSAVDDESGGVSCTCTLGEYKCV